MSRFDPLCACSGGGGSSCGRPIAVNEDDEAWFPLETIQAVCVDTPVSAASYEPDPSDPIDMELSVHLRSLHHAALSKMMLQRLFPGEYAIDGRHVSVHWGSSGTGPCRGTEILVSEETEEGDWDSIEHPLQLYLIQALDVAASLGGSRESGAPAVLRVPPDDRLSFFDLPAVPNGDPEAERLFSMARACEEARLRERQAEVYDRAKLGQERGQQILRTSSNSLTAESRIPRMPSDAARGDWIGLEGISEGSGSMQTPLAVVHKAPASASGMGRCAVSSRQVRGPMLIAAPIMAPAMNMEISRSMSGIPPGSTRIWKV